MSETNGDAVTHWVTLTPEEVMDRETIKRVLADHPEGRISVRIDPSRPLPEWIGGQHREHPRPRP